MWKNTNSWYCLKVADVSRLCSQEGSGVVKSLYVRCSVCKHIQSTAVSCSIGLDSVKIRSKMPDVRPRNRATKSSCFKKAQVCYTLTTVYQIDVWPQHIWENVSFLFDWNLAWRNKQTKKSAVSHCRNVSAFCSDGGYWATIGQATLDSSTTWSWWRHLDHVIYTLFSQNGMVICSSDLVFESSQFSYERLDIVYSRFTYSPIDCLTKIEN